MDLHSSYGYPGRASSTSSSSSSSYDPGIYTPTAGPYPDESRTRTPTPTAPKMSAPFTIPSYQGVNTHTSPTNPWAKIIAAAKDTPPVPVSPGSSGSASRSPEDLSRSSTPTPFAPQPLKPFKADPQLLSPRDDYASPPPYLFATFPTYVQQHTSGIPYTVGFDEKLLVQLITPELITQHNRRIPQIALRQGWKSPQHVYQWAIRHYKTAFLLWMAEDLQAWPKAFVMGLEDKDIPYAEEALKGIATNPSKVADLQWKVAIKQLPRDGHHTEFTTSQVVPLDTQPNIRMEVPDASKKKRLDCVKFCDKTTDVIFVRKRLDVKNGPEKEAILAQIRDFHTISHANIAAIAGSYARGQTVAILSERTEANLVDYLDTFAGGAEQLLSWMLDLTSALKYLHDSRIVHKSIRPHKILVDPRRKRISYAIFGITQPARASATALWTPYSTEPAYIYAAPETVSRREASFPADIFSLGCVLLEMATCAKGLDVSSLEAYRSTISHDSSYHMNLERVDAWTQQLRVSKPQAPSSRIRRDRHGAQIEHVLNAVRTMVSAEPESRPSAKRVVSYLEKGAAAQQVRRPRRRSDVGAEIGRAVNEREKSEQGGLWGELESLNGYYNHQGYGGSGY
ncbi:kinase-like protein [Microthyrium microscopicum]|uniref:Kinase-like protein n=1 Tax=Microthyrium microscopicum TaxID=703497 RepID=A0A6A6U4P2_9PEZI|nr:kinase-like protein [Microthyrium microscopicum]